MGGWRIGPHVRGWFNDDGAPDRPYRAHRAQPAAGPEPGAGQCAFCLCGFAVLLPVPGPLSAAPPHESGYPHRGDFRGGQDRAAAGGGLGGGAVLSLRGAAERTPGAGRLARGFAQLVDWPARVAQRHSRVAHRPTQLAQLARPGEQAPPQQHALRGAQRGVSSSCGSAGFRADSLAAPRGFPRGGAAPRARRARACYLRSGSQWRGTRRSSRFDQPWQPW